MNEIQKNSVVTLDIEDLAYGGNSLGRLNGFVVFVQGGVPGDRVKARIIKKSKNHAQAVIQEIERPSDRRIEAPCPIFDNCGGCSFQNLSYEDQLVWKQKQVADTLKHLGGQAAPPVLPILASPEIWNYRNKMEYSFGRGADGTIVGFHTPGRFDQIFEVPQCLIHPKPYDSLLTALTSFAREHDLDSYDPRSHRGFLRHVVMRHSKTTGGVVLVLITDEGQLDVEALCEHVRGACPELQGFVWGINTGLADVAVIQHKRYEWGNPILKETINGLTFSISPQSFFQTNTLGAARLYSATVEMAELSESDCVMDAYCGAGSIGLHCARHVKRVVGIEIVKEAVWDARANAKANGIKNATFIAAPVDEGLSLAKSAALGPYTHVIIDPPRGGMDKRSLNGLIDLRAPNFIYVSCNPATLSRDLQVLGEGGYQVESVRPVDMFPHTYHIESIVRLKRAAN